MGASFRNIGQIEELAGCDRLTISPTLLDELSLDLAKLERKLHPSNSSDSTVVEQTESSFRLGLNADAMAHEKLERAYVFLLGTKSVLRILSPKHLTSFQVLIKA